MLLQLQNDESLRNLRANVMCDQWNAMQNITLMDTSEKQMHLENDCGANERDHYHLFSFMFMYF